MIARKLINAIAPPAPRCCRKHCQQWAKFVPVLRIPAKGCPLAEHEPIAVVIEIPLCEHHADSVKAGEFATPALRRTVKEQCRQLRKAEPDFSRAFVQKKPIGQDIQ